MSRRRGTLRRPRRRWGRCCTKPALAQKKGFQLNIEDPDLAGRCCPVKSKDAKPPTRRKSTSHAQHILNTVYWDAGTADCCPRLTHDRTATVCHPPQTRPLQVPQRPRRPPRHQDFRRDEGAGPALLVTFPVNAGGVNFHESRGGPKHLRGREAAPKLPTSKPRDRLGVASTHLTPDEGGERHYQRDHPQGRGSSTVCHERVLDATTSTDNRIHLHRDPKPSELGQWVVEVLLPSVREGIFGAFIRYVHRRIGGV